MDINSVLHSASDQIASMRGIAQANTAWSAQQAQIQREWQEQQNAKAMAFNQVEAAKNRNWQELLSNTAHQREVRDLMAAGLNPVLSAMNGNGASVGSGATAQGVTSQGAKGEADTSANGAIASLLSSILGARTQLEAANITARTQEAVAEKYTAMSKIVADIQSEAARYGTDKRYTSDMARIAEDAATAAARMLTDKSIATGHDAASIAAAAARRPDIITATGGTSESSSSGSSGSSGTSGTSGLSKGQFRQHGVTFTPQPIRWSFGTSGKRETSGSQLVVGSDGYWYRRSVSKGFGGVLKYGVLHRVGSYR